MTLCPEIIDFKKFLEIKLNNGEIIQLTTKYLTSPGDNYGSVMLITNVEFAKNEVKQKGENFFFFYSMRNKFVDFSSLLAEMYANYCENTTNQQ